MCLATVQLRQTGTCVLLQFNSDRYMCLATVQLRQTGTCVLLQFNSDRYMCLATVQLRQTGTCVLLQFNSDRQVHVPCYSSTQTDRYMCLATVQLRQTGTCTLLQFTQAGTYALLLFNSDIHLAPVQLRKVHIHLAAVVMNRQVYLPCSCSTQTDRYTFTLLLLR